MVLIQLTGLSGSGKTTLAYGVRKQLEEQGITVHVIDGDEYRKTLCRDLGFSKADRQENVRRLGAAAHGLLQPGAVAIISAISPYEGIRKELETKYEAHTVWVHCPLNVLMERDTKGLYHRAQLPENDPQRVTNLTGVNDTYEQPASPALRIDTHLTTPEAATDQLCRYVLDRLGR
jgi:adenylylsulfate kinase